LGETEGKWENKAPRCRKSGGTGVLFSKTQRIINTSGQGGGGEHKKITGEFPRILRGELNEDLSLAGGVEVDPEEGG